MNSDIDMNYKKEYDEAMQEVRRLQQTVGHLEGLLKEKEDLLASYQTE